MSNCALMAFSISNCSPAVLLTEYKQPVYTRTGTVYTACVVSSRGSCCLNYKCYAAYLKHDVIYVMVLYMYRDVDWNIDCNIDCNIDWSVLYKKDARTCKDMQGYARICKKVQSIQGKVVRIIHLSSVRDIML